MYILKEKIVNKNRNYIYTGKKILWGGFRLQETTKMRHLMKFTHWTQLFCSFYQQKYIYVTISLFYYYNLHISKSRSHPDAVWSRKCFRSWRLLMSIFTEDTRSRPELTQTLTIIFTLCVRTASDELLCSQLLCRNGFTLDCDRRATRYSRQWSEEREVRWIPPASAQSIFL